MYVHNLFMSLYKKIFLQKEFWCTNKMHVYTKNLQVYTKGWRDSRVKSVNHSTGIHKIMKTIESKITSDFLSWKIRESMLSPILVKKVVLELNIWILTLLYQEPIQ